MPANLDHLRRDAEHAARNTISTCVGKFVRRMNEAAKATVAGDIAALESSEEPVVVDFDTGTRLGEEAAKAAILEYLFENPDKVTAPPSLARSS